jgi:hypothetical protein
MVMPRLMGSSKSGGTLSMLDMPGYLRVPGLFIARLGRPYGTEKILAVGQS